jgi:cytoskeletal protein RodZ
MSNAQRLGLVAVAIAIVIVAFVLLRPGSDDNDSKTTSTTAQTQTAPATTTTTTEPARAEPGTAPKPKPKPKPKFVTVETKDGVPVGGTKEIAVKKGETARFEVTSNTEEEVHLHGYDVLETAAPGKPARFVVKADIEGIFEVEMHKPDGSHGLVAELKVEP